MSKGLHTMPDVQGNEWKRSPGYVEEHDKLPVDVRPVFELLVDEYKFHATRHHKHPFVSYKVLAELVRSGWRPLQSEYDSKDAGHLGREE